MVPHPARPKSKGYTFVQHPVMGRQWVSERGREGEKERECVRLCMHAHCVCLCVCDLCVLACVRVCM